MTGPDQIKQAGDPLDDPEYRSALGLRLSDAASRPGFEEWTLSILDRTLADPRSPDAVDRLRESLIEYIGDPDVALLLMTAITFDDDLGEFANLFYEEVDQRQAGELTGMLRRIRSRYRADLQRARDAWAEGPNDWRSVFLNVAYSFSRSLPTIDVTVELHSGEKITIESTASGFSTLVSYLTEQLIDLPIEAMPEPWDLARLLAAAFGVIERYGDDAGALPFDAETVARFGDAVRHVLDRAEEPEEVPA